MTIIRLPGDNSGASSAYTHAKVALIFGLIAAMVVSDELTVTCVLA